jgi:hypothetical protein
LSEYAPSSERQEQPLTNVLGGIGTGTRKRGEILRAWAKEINMEGNQEGHGPLIGNDCTT